MPSLISVFVYNKCHLGGFVMVLLILDSSVAYNLSSVMRKSAFCICENKGTDELRGDIPSTSS